MQANNYIIARFGVSINFADSPINDSRLIGSFEPFRTSVPADDKLFSLDVDDAVRPIPKDQRHRIRRFDTGNGDTIVDKLEDGGYQYIIKDIEGADCCLLITDKDFANCRCALNGTPEMRRFGLNSALMLVLAFAGARRQTLLLHASLVRCKGKGYAFIAKSGTGKSTQVSNWMRYIPGCDIMNDDNPIVRIIDGKPIIFGCPWSGKTPCYRNVEAPLGAITRIDRADKNFVEALSPIEAFASVLPSCSSMKWDSDIYSSICDTVTRIIETTGIYILHCLPDKESAEVCYKAIVR